MVIRHAIESKRKGRPQKRMGRKLIKRPKEKKKKIKGSGMSFQGRVNGLGNLEYGDCRNVERMVHANAGAKMKERRKPQHDNLFLRN